MNQYLTWWQSPPNFRGDLKISDQNNWGGGQSEQKIKFGGGGERAKFKVGPRILGGPTNPNDAMVNVL